MGKTLQGPHFTQPPVTSGERKKITRIQVNKPHHSKNNKTQSLVLYSSLPTLVARYSSASRILESSEQLSRADYITHLL